MAAVHLKFLNALQQLPVYLACFALLALLVTTQEIVVKEVGVSPAKNPYCTFFNNRKPEFQPNLKNCTWYQDNCCCRQVEIEVAFGKVKALQGATPACQKYINYLICYICAPTQFEFYIWQQLTVCKEFCDLIFENCKDAILKGSRIGELYNNGTHFCGSRRFKVTPLADGGCFYFNETMDTSSNGTRVRQFTTSMLWAAMIAILTTAYSLR